MWHYYRRRDTPSIVSWAVWTQWPVCVRTERRRYCCGCCGASPGWDASTYSCVRASVCLRSAGKCTNLFHIKKHSVLRRKWQRFIWWRSWRRVWEKPSTATVTSAGPAAPLPRFEKAFYSKISVGLDVSVLKKTPIKHVKRTNALHIQ